jgi:hypothetical protein
VSKPDPYLERQARAISDSMLREQLAKEQKADAERQLAELILESTRTQLRKAGAL